MGISCICTSCGPMGGFFLQLKLKLRKEQRASKHDVGWAWVIVFASFTMQLIIDGTLSGFGTFFLAMQKDKAFIQRNYTRTELSVSGSIQTGAFLCSGVLASPFIQRFGFRVTGGFGSLMAGSGIAFSSLQTNLHLFNIFYGIVTGSGFGILMICAIVSVNYYFERLRGTASGIAMSGAGVGYLCVPFLFSYLVPRFGWRYTLLLYSASIFVLLVSAVLVIRPFVIVASDGSEVDEEHTENVKQTQVGHPTTNVSRANGAVPERSEYHPGNKQNGPEAPDNEVSMAPLTILALADDDQLSVGETAFSTASRTRAYLANIKEDKAAKLVMPLGDETLADTGDHVNCELKDTPTPQSFANRSGQYQLRQNGLRTSGPLAAVNEQADDDLGSTVGSRLWKSTLAFKRSNPPPRSQRTYSSSRIRSIESRDASSHQNVKCKSAGKKSFVVDPFGQMDVFFSGSLASLGYYDTHRTRHTSEQRSTLFSSQLHDPSRFGSLQSSAIQSINHVEPSQTQFYCPRVGFTDIADRPSELLGDYEKRPPSSWLSKVDEADWYGQRNNYITSEETVNHQATWDSEYRLNKVLRFREWIVTVFDLKLFTIPSFLFITAIGVATQLAYFIPFVYLTDFAMSKGMEQNDANLLLVILGATHTIGRIMSGCAANMSWVDTVYLSGLGSLFAAAVTLLLPSAFPVGFAWYGVYAATFGMSVAFPIPMVPIILVRFLGLQRLTASYSNLNMIKGIASVVGPLIAVSIVERTGQTDHYFYVAGVCFSFAALAHLGLCRFCCCITRLEDVDPRSNCCLTRSSHTHHVDDGEFDDVYHASGHLASNHFSPHQM